MWRSVFSSKLPWLNFSFLHGFLKFAFSVLLFALHRCLLSTFTFKCTVPHCASQVYVHVYSFIVSCWSQDRSVSWGGLSKFDIFLVITLTYKLFSLFSLVWKACLRFGELAAVIMWWKLDLSDLLCLFFFLALIHFFAMLFFPHSI